VKGRKGFAAMTAKRRAEIQAMGTKAAAKKAKAV
jgi:hypothetical protein